MTDRTTPPDPALDRMSAVVGGLVGIMQHGRMPAVDLADEREILADAGRGLVGIGEASGPDRARQAAALAVADLLAQLRPKAGEPDAG